MSLPAPFIARMRSLLGDEAEALFAALAEAPAVGLRVNTLKLSPAELSALVPWPLTPLPWCDAGFVVETGEAGAQPGKHPYHAAGLYYLQDPAAMAVAEALGPAPGAWVLDLAAAPGGKSTHLAASMADRGLLVANEVSRSRAGALLANLERWGVRSALVTSASVEKLAARWGARFDEVLLDAPCSGEGMFRKSPEARAHWSEANMAGCAARQRDLLDAAARLVAPGGVIIYSTCTFAPEENEALVAAFLKAHPEFVALPLALPGSSPGLPGFGLEPERLARYWPHRAPGEGHTLAKLQRTELQRTESHLDISARSPRAHAYVTAAPSQARSSWRAFAEATLSSDPAAGRQLAVFGQQLYALPEELPDLAGVRALRAGLWLGTLKTKRLEPAHALALALRPEELAGARRLDLTRHDPRVLRYLHGHPLEAPGEDGWLVVTVDGFALGWVKRSRGTLANHYPKGLRWLEPSSGRV